MLRRLRQTLPYVAVIAVGCTGAFLIRHCETCRHAFEKAAIHQTDGLLFGIPPEGWTALFTGLLTLSTIALWRVTFIAAIAAKKGADIAERTLSDLETPFLYPVVASTNLGQIFEPFLFYDQPNNPSDGVTPESSVRIKNYGRTPALLRAVSAQLDHWDKMPADSLDDLMGDTAVEPVLEPGNFTSQTFASSTAFPITAAEYTKLKNRDGYIFLHGLVEFSDIFGNEWSQTFCLVWGFTTKSFIPWSGRYNQRKRSQRTA